MVTELWKLLCSMKLMVGEKHENLQKKMLQVPKNDLSLKCWDFCLLKMVLFGQRSSEIGSRISVHLKSV